MNTVLGRAGVLGVAAVPAVVGAGALPLAAGVAGFALFFEGFAHMAAQRGKFRRRRKRGGERADFWTATD